jgi:hypothetical protein
MDITGVNLAVIVKGALFVDEATCGRTAESATIARTKEFVDVEFGTIHKKAPSFGSLLAMLTQVPLLPVAL